MARDPDVKHRMGLSATAGLSCSQGSVETRLTCGGIVTVKEFRKSVVFDEVMPRTWFILFFLTRCNSTDVIHSSSLH